MYNEANGNGTLTPKLTNVTFSSNTVRGGLNSGGAMYNFGNVGTTAPDLTNVTFFANSANFGGAMCNQSPPNTLSNTTPRLQSVTFNRNVAEFGGAIYNAGGNNVSVYADLRNVILWGDTASVEPDSAEIYNQGANVSIDHSVFEAGCPSLASFSCASIFTGDPLLGVLADNGGFTRTLLPRAGSSALDTADDATCPSIDQRGTARPQGAHCDIGAVEIVATPAPVADPKNVVIPENTSTQITLTASDPNSGGPFSFTITGPVQHGSVSISGNVVTYSPDKDYTGTDSFLYTATDSNGPSLPATVTILVNAGPPVAKSFSVEIPHNTSTSLTLSATDPNTGSFTFTYAIVAETPHGAISLSGDAATYTPTHNYTGLDEFTYTATDVNGPSLPATVTIKVDPAPPVADNKIVTTPYNTPKQITLSGSDNDNLGGPFALTFSLATPPAHGTLSTISGSFVTYMPNHNYSGLDSFTYTSMDTNGESARATVQITVLPPGVGPPPPSNTSAIPTLSTWGLLALAGLIGITSVARRRKI